MNSKKSFSEDYLAYLSKIEPSLQDSALDDIELVPDCRKSMEVAGPCNSALSPLDWWSES